MHVCYTCEQDIDIDIDIESCEEKKIKEKRPTKQMQGNNDLWMLRIKKGQEGKVSYRRKSYFYLIYLQLLDSQKAFLFFIIF